MSVGELFVVATPIGNLQDISPRAVEVLGDVDLVVAEDTRHSRPLLTHVGVDTRLQAMHEHNEASLVPELIERLRQGQSIAVISDAGTPLISDPGFRLVRAAQDAGIDVRAVPGPSAVTAALSVCGLPTDRFAFEGFLPARDRARRQKLKSLGQEARTLVFFETGRRILASLADIESEIGPDRDIAVCRELTKRFETVLRGTVADVRAAIESDSDQERGEFVLVLAGAEPVSADVETALALAQELALELPASKAARIAARLTGVPRRELFAALSADDVSPDQSPDEGDFP
jgi:16S rRNA (cytidine1402-2'-O)-methyltransferase